MGETLLISNRKSRQACFSDAMPKRWNWPHPEQLQDLGGSKKLSRQTCLLQSRPTCIGTCTQRIICDCCPKFLIVVVATPSKTKLAQVSVHAPCWTYSFRAIALDGPSAGTLIQSFVHKSSDAVCPKEAEHTNTSRLGAILGHGLNPVGRRRNRCVVQVETEQVDRCDGKLHATRGGKLCNFLSRRLLDTLGAEAARDHSRQDKACADDERVPKQEGPISCHGHRALYLRRLSGLRKHLRESHVLGDGGARVSAGRPQQLH